MKPILDDLNASRKILDAQGYQEGGTCASCEYLVVEATADGPSFTCGLNAAFRVPVNKDGSCNHRSPRPGT